MVATADAGMYMGTAVVPLDYRLFLALILTRMTTRTHRRAELCRSRCPDCDQQLGQPHPLVEGPKRGLGDRLRWHPRRRR